jgi:endonuclease/exonuclease/phosphatase family metal-dependent hydrolase
MAREHSYFSNLPTYKYDFEFESWKEAAICSRRSVTSTVQTELTIVTLNVLFDSYFEDKIHTRKRFPFILDLLQKTKADIIGLQEVTQTFLIELLRQDWVNFSFFSH